MTYQFNKYTERKYKKRLVRFLVVISALLIWLVLTWAFGIGGVWIGTKCFEAKLEVYLCVVVMNGPLFFCLIFFSNIVEAVIRLGRRLYAKSLKRRRRRRKEFSGLGF